MNKIEKLDHNLDIFMKDQYDILGYTETELTALLIYLLREKEAILHQLAIQDQLEED